MPSLHCLWTKIDLGGSRVLPLLKFRGQLRPVIIAGSKVFVDRAVRAADPYMLQLRQRGVSGEHVELNWHSGICRVVAANELSAVPPSVVPLILNDSPEASGRQPDLDPDAKILALKREFQRGKDM